MGGGGGTSEKYLKMTQTLLNDTARYVNNWNRRTKSLDLMKYCNWMTIVEMRDFHSLLLMWRVVRTGAPKHLSDIVNLVDEDYLETSNPSLMTIAQGFRWRTVQLWNTLPGDLRSEDTLKNFKKSINRWLMEQRQYVSRLTIVQMRREKGIQDIQTLRMGGGVEQT